MVQTNGHSNGVATNGHAASFETPSILPPFQAKDYKYKEYLVRSYPEPVVAIRRLMRVVIANISKGRLPAARAVST